MSVEGQKFYPGCEALADELLELAGEYGRAAELLRPAGRRKAPLSYVPYRLLAIHAVELYLNAYLLTKGNTAASLRGLQHNLAERTRSAEKADLKLRKLTSLHLRKMTENREYLVVRYDAAQVGTVSQLNRLEATLTEVAEKVETAMGRK